MTIADEGNPENVIEIAQEIIQFVRKSGKSQHLIMGALWLVIATILAHSKPKNEKSDDKYINENIKRLKKEIEDMRREIKRQS